MDHPPSTSYEEPDIYGDIIFPRPLKPIETAVPPSRVYESAYSGVIHPTVHAIELSRSVIIVGVSFLLNSISWEIQLLVPAGVHYASEVYRDTRVGVTDGPDTPIVATTRVPMRQDTVTTGVVPPAGTMLLSADVISSTGHLTKLPLDVDK